MAGLTALKVKKAREPGKYHDGAGLILIVKPSGAASWVLRTMVAGRRYELGLGSRDDVSLAEARDAARIARKKLKAGATPATLRAEANKSLGLTFAEAARAVHTERLPGWKNAKHAAQWITTLESYAFPSIGGLPVSDMGSAHILDIIQPLWLEKPETARRTKQRIGTVLDWAHAREHRTEPAPMRAVDAALKKQKKAGAKHFAAMPYPDIPALMRRLEKSSGMGALALRFTILTAARSGEVRGATWGEIDLEGKTWTVPAARMKAGEEHVVPLSQAAMDILESARLLTTGAHGTLLFPGTKQRPLSDMTLSKALKTAGGEGFTVHGARSSFRDWAAETTEFPGDVVEAALAHKLRNKVEAAYRRTNYLEKRRELMGEWAAFITGEACHD